MFSTPLFGQDAREIVNRYLDTVSNGNINNWNKIKSIYKESVSYYSQQDFEHKVDFLKKDKASFSKSFLVLPHEHKIELYADSAFTNLSSSFYYLENRSILLIGNVPPIIKQPPPRDEFFSHHHPVEIWKRMDKSKSVELLGIKEFPTEELTCYEIKINAKGRNDYLYINTKTFFLEYWSGNEEGDRSALGKYDNYQKVEGFLMPMSVSSMKNGIVFYWNHTKKIQINADIDPEIFEYKEK